MMLLIVAYLKLKGIIIMLAVPKTNDHTKLLKLLFPIAPNIATSIFSF